jgi:hypothetical protein
MESFEALGESLTVIMKMLDKKTIDFDKPSKIQDNVKMNLKKLLLFIQKTKEIKTVFKLLILVSITILFFTLIISFL